MKTAVTAAALFTPLERIENPVLVFEDGIISSLGSREASEIPAGARTLDFPSAILAPGFVDMHIHGAAGYDVMEGDAAKLAEVERLLSRHGVTSYAPTTVTAPFDATVESLDKLAAVVEAAAGNREAGRAQPLGMHLEGPFISQARRGVHTPENIVAPTLELFERFWQAARGHLAVLTIAPEVPGAKEVIAEAARRGVCVSIGHSNAELDDARGGIDAGARHATHTFNAMRRLEHRDPGILGAILTDPRLSADIIVDGVHVAPEIVALFLKAKGPEKAVLITDAISATGMPDGRYRLGLFEAEVNNGTCLSHGKLAGSVLTLDRAIRNAMAFSGWDLQTTVRLATLNPARALGIEKRKGVLAAGADADIVALTPSGEVVKTIARGRPAAD